MRLNNFLEGYEARPVPKKSVAKRINNVSLDEYEGGEDGQQSFVESAEDLGDDGEGSYGDEGECEESSSCDDDDSESLDADNDDWGERVEQHDDGEHSDGDHSDDGDVSVEG